jgi:hypothetical protein
VGVGEDRVPALGGSDDRLHNGYLRWKLSPLYNIFTELNWTETDKHTYLP